MALGLAACSPPSTTQEEGKAAPRAVAPTPVAAACEDPAEDPSRSWASFDGQPCGFELRQDDEQLVLAQRVLDAPAAPRGDPPPPCLDHACVYEGLWTEVGPLVQAVVPATDSEMPASVWLGVVSDSRLVFVNLWEGAGEPVVTDHTRVGPAHALAPFVCGDRLALLTVERLEAGRGVAPPPALRAREGLLDASAPQAPTGAVQRADCRQVTLPVP